MNCGNSLRESLFFKKEIAEKSAELLGMLGVDEYLEEEEGAMEEESDDDEHWEDVEYQVRWAHKVLPLSLQKAISDDYQLVMNHVPFFVRQKPVVSEPLPFCVNYHWHIRPYEALIDCYALAQTQKHPNMLLTYSSLSTRPHQEKQLTQCIQTINSQWEFEGIEVTSALLNGSGCDLILRLKQCRFRFWAKWGEVSLQDLLIHLKSCILLTAISCASWNESRTAEQLMTAYAQTSLYKKIALIYRLNKEFGLTLALNRDRTSISNSLLTRSNNTTYRKCIAHIAKLSGFEQATEVRDALAVGGESMEKAFDQVYLRSLREHDYESL